MFCPEDGTEVKVKRDLGKILSYETCPKCGTRWVYNGDRGTYEQAERCGFCYSVEHDTSDHKAR